MKAVCLHISVIPLMLFRYIFLPNKEIILQNGHQTINTLIRESRLFTLKPGKYCHLQHCAVLVPTEKYNINKQDYGETFISRYLSGNRKRNHRLYCRTANCNLSLTMFHIFIIVQLGKKYFYLWSSLNQALQYFLRKHRPCQFHRVSILSSIIE